VWRPVNKQEQKTILDCIDGFCEALRSKGYSERTLRVDRPVLEELGEFFREAPPLVSTDFIDKFISWKINRRAKKKYHWSHRYRQARNINGFFAYYLKTNKTLSYQRERLEEVVPGYVSTYTGNNKRGPIEIRNTLSSFFDFITQEDNRRLKKGGDEPIDQQVIANFLDYTEKSFYKKRKRYSTAYRGRIRQLLLDFHDHLVECGHVSFYLPPLPAKEEPFYFEAPIREYLEYVCQSGLSQSTIGSATRELRKFDCYLQEKGITSLTKVKIIHIDEHVQKQIAPENLRGIHRLNCILRRFLKYLYVTDRIKNDIAKYIVAAPIYKLSDVPKHLSADEVKSVLTFPRPLSKADMKKRAVLSLLMFNGLRVGEVSKLTLDDLDWDEQTITVTMRKNRQPLITPMSDYVKASLMEYVYKARPNHLPYREVFISEFAPKSPIGSRGITQMMIRQLRKHGITCGGGHRMRHTFGTYLLDSNSSLQEAQLLLGHSRANATRIYGKSSMKRMREHVVTDEI